MTALMHGSRRKLLLLATSVFASLFYLNFKQCLNSTFRHKSRDDWTCVDWKSSDTVLREAKLGNPTIKLDPDKFLLPWLYNGPTNQLWGLRQAAYLAIALNRTLVLPLFHKHLTDASGPNAIIDASHRFQLEELVKMIPIISLREFTRKCGRRLDAVFPAAPYQRWMPKSLMVAEREMGFGILRHSPKGRFASKSLYNLPVAAEGSRQISGDPDVLREFYQAEVKCILYTFPFREIKADINRTVTMSEYLAQEAIFQEAPDQVHDWFLSNALFLKMQTPKYIQEVAARFLKTFADGLYMAVHWRYDEEDFKKFMCGKTEGKGNRNQAEMCHRVLAVTPTALGKAIADHVKFVNREGHTNIKSVYISAPRETILPFLRQLEDTLIGLGVRVVNQNDFDDFVRSSGVLTHCPFIGDDLNDFRALAEMEICARSRVFLRSVYSSWSDSVVINRVLLHKDKAQRRFDVPAVALKGVAPT